ncbi:MAG: MCE family protein [Paramuribaculum sp.]|nr:MCE family protein [Paramuribaculum sp.]
MKKIFKKEFLIGLTVLITLLILLFGIDYLKGINVFKAANYYYVSYTNVAGLSKSAPVSINGYKVGIVRDIEYEFDNPGHIRVELSLDKKLRVPMGSEAILVTDMLGTSTIELKMNDHPDYHEIGSHLIGVNSKGLMDNVTSELLPSVTTMLPKVDSILSSVSMIVGDPNLLAAIQRLDNVMANIQKTTANLSAAVAKTPAMVSEAQLTLDNIKELSANLSSLSANLKNTIEGMPLDSTMQNVYNITANLDRLTKQLDNKNSSLGLLMNDASLYENLNRSVADLDSLFVDIKKNPKRYISIKLL